MATRLFWGQLQALRGFPDIGNDELIRFFTLRGLGSNGRKSANGYEPCSGAKTTKSVEVGPPSGLHQPLFASDAVVYVPSNAS